MAKSPIGRVDIVSERPIGVREASAVVSLGDDVFAIASDEDGLFRCQPGASPQRLSKPGALPDLEGLCRVDGVLYALTEKAGRVWRMSLADDALSPCTQLGALQAIGDEDNHGWEGLAYAAPGVIEPRATLVAIHQTAPRRIGFFDPATLEARAIRKLPKQAKRALDDLNDVTIDRARGHILVLSGEAACIVELRLAGDELELIASYEIDLDEDGIAEGIDLDREGRLWIVSDGTGILRELRRSL